MDQCITKQVLHVYSMDMRNILCCNNTIYNLIRLFKKFSRLCNQCTSVWSMFPCNTSSVKVLL